MKKRMILLLLTAAFVLALAACAKKPGYTERTVKVFSLGEETGEQSLRFYEGTPNIPYMGMNECAVLLGRQPFIVHAKKNGRCELENWNGARLLCDTKEGRISVQDWNAFFALPMPLEDRALGIKDLSVHFARITDIAYEGEAAPVTLDFAKYGIQLYSDKNDIYLPVSTLSNMMTDLAFNFALYNGENLYVQRFVPDDSLTDGQSASDALQAQFRGEERPEDIIRQCYADLCFNFDYFYGYPGKTVFEEALAEKGLDQALESLGEEGRAIREGLLSSSAADYIEAMMKLFFGYLNDGHTTFADGVAMAVEYAGGSDTSFAERIMSSYEESLLNAPFTMKQLQATLIPIQRTLLWGEDAYREYGSTAIIRLDSFEPDEAAWDSYYNDAGEFPQDDLGIVAA